MRRTQSLHPLQEASPAGAPPPAHPQAPPSPPPLPRRLSPAAPVVRGLSLKRQLSLVRQAQRYAAASSGSGGGGGGGFRSGGGGGGGGSSFTPPRPLPRTSFRQAAPAGSEAAAARAVRLARKQPLLAAALFGAALELAPPVLLVDAYNVINTWPKMARLFEAGELAGARELLIAELEQFSHLRGFDVVCVFDASGGPARLPVAGAGVGAAGQDSNRSAGGVEVRAAPLPAQNIDRASCSPQTHTHTHNDAHA